VKVAIKDILDALEMQSEDYLSFVNVVTAQVETVSREMMGAAEESDEMPDIPEWQEREWETADRIVKDDNFKRLPTQFDTHEWSIMEDFTLSVESERIRGELMSAIHGRGAFRNFKDSIRRLRIEKDWFTFRDEALREIAVEWCEENGLEWK
jgi:hypothetical protein